MLAYVNTDFLEPKVASLKVIETKVVTYLIKFILEFDKVIFLF